MRLIGSCRNSCIISAPHQCGNIGVALPKTSTQEYMAMSISDGTVFTYWTTIGTPEKIGNYWFVNCRCKCGTEKHVRVSKLR